MITKKLPLHIDDIKKAQNILDRNARKTPLVKSFYLTSKTGGEIHLKLENMQLTGSFKFRGAFNKNVTADRSRKREGE